MIDPTLRHTAIRVAAEDPRVRVLLVDVVLGYGAHRDPELTISRVGDAIDQGLQGLAGRTPEDIRRLRREKFLAIGRAV